MTAAELLGRVRDLKPAIATRAAECERLRRLPDETFRDCQEAGLFRWFQPRSLYREKCCWNADLLWPANGPHPESYR